MTDFANWPFPNKPSLGYRITSNTVMTAVTMISKLWIDGLNQLQVHNKSAFLKLTTNRCAKPLITVANHHCNVDDPFIWSIFPWSFLLLKSSQLRYTLAAKDLCFTNPLYSRFFAIGRCIPTIRGNGVYQKAVDYCIEKLDGNGWVHVFPEGKVNIMKKPIRFKWGVGRMLVDCRRMPLVLPIWTCGFDEVLPPFRPYIPRFHKRVTVVIGDPLDFESQLNALREKAASPREMRKIVTDVIEYKMRQLEKRTVQIHNSRTN